MVALASDDLLEQIRATAEDLMYLRTEWDEEVEDASLRRASPVLRRLLVDNELSRAWRALGLDKQPIISAPSLEVYLAGIPYRRVSYAQAGGATFHGMTVEGTLEQMGVMSPEQIHKRFMAQKDGIARDFSLSRFVESPCIAVRGQLIARRTLVKYVANKLGGAHSFDSARKPGRTEDMQFALLDEIRRERIVADKPAIYFELLSIGQSLVSSPDIESFLQRAKGAVGS